MAAAAKAAPTAKAAAPAAPAVAANMVKDTDPNAIALQYSSDAKKVDAKKSAKYKAGDNCANCALYKGDAKLGDCPLFAGKKVAAGAWCSAHAKKA
jgi:pyrimidine deaminase RibD-like protein